MRLEYTHVAEQEATHFLLQGYLEEEGQNSWTEAVAHQQLKHEAASAVVSKGECKYPRTRLPKPVSSMMFNLAPHHL